MRTVRQICESASNRATRQIGRRWGDAFPMFFICEHPKSGGTWLGSMIADCLQLPFPKRPAAPIAMPAVVHAHWDFDPRLHRTTHIVRDGRDVMVSFYFHFVRHAQSRAGNRDEPLVRTLRRLFGRDADLNDTLAHMPRFIDHIFRRPLGSTLNWRDYVEAWSDRPGVVQACYERLLECVEPELGRILTELTGKSPDAWRVRLAAEKYSMRLQTGRAPGQENRASFIRKGVAGDWVNHFSREARECFDDRAGDALLSLGYESDREWARHDVATRPVLAEHAPTSTSPHAPIPIAPIRADSGAGLHLMA